MNIKFIILSILIYTTLFAQEIEVTLVGSKVTDTSLIAVLKTEKYWGFKGLESSNLNINEIEICETLLKDTIRKYNEEGAKIDLKQYHRQYFAAVNKNRDKIVIINCFCEKPALNWKEEFCDIDDGGDCYFKLKINLTQNKIFELDINGS